eukprot:377468_1
MSTVEKRYCLHPKEIEFKHVIMYWLRTNRLRLNIFPANLIQVIIEEYCDIFISPLNAKTLGKYLIIDNKRKVVQRLIEGDYDGFSPLQTSALFSTAIISEMCDVFEIEYKLNAFDKEENYCHFRIGYSMCLELKSWNEAIGAPPNKYISEGIWIIIFRSSKTYTTHEFKKYNAHQIIQHISTDELVNT